jgi:uncharacterized membrane protein YraQ (UPF0718 family)
MKKGKKSYAGFYFLLIVVIFYVLVGVFRAELVLPSLEFSLNIAKSILPVFILVFVFMAGINYFVSPKAVARHLGKESGIRRWIFAVAGGILSTGPIYMWYPMLRDFKDKGVNYGFVATFLYNRAIKLPLLPVIIFYFGLEFTVVLTVLMVIFSIIQGVLIEKILER